MKFLSGLFGWFSTAFDVLNIINIVAFFKLNSYGTGLRHTHIYVFLILLIFSISFHNLSKFIDQKYVRNSNPGGKNIN